MKVTVLWRELQLEDDCEQAKGDGKNGMAWRCERDEDKLQEIHCKKIVELTKTQDSCKVTYQCMNEITDE